MKSSIALLSNINLDPLKNNLQQKGFGEVYVAGYNQWQYELLNEASELINHSYDYLLLYLHPDELASGFEVNEITVAIDHYLQRQPHGIVLLSELANRPLYITSYAGEEQHTHHQLNRELYDYASKQARVTIMQLSRLVSLHGYTTLFDDKYWYLGRMKFSHIAYNILADEILHLTHAIEGKTCKVLVLDLDNTLWGGVVGEEGWQNIDLSNEGRGLIYKELQQQIAALKKTGILLSLCSKNNEQDVKEVFTNHPYTVLKWDDFVAPQVNWLPKDENLLSISRELNIGIDSFVFIDDNPLERELVHQSLPSVQVPDFPSDITDLNQWFVEKVVYPYFARISYTNEDADKTTQYKRNKEREEVRNQFNYDDFILQLNIETKLQEATTDSLNRIAQLTQKTNQFNLNLKRYTEAEIAAMYADINWKLYTCTYRDKFGDEGIIGAILVHIEYDSAYIDNFLLSCRVLGRRVEFTLLDRLITQLRVAGMQRITAHFHPGEKNIPARNFYIDGGFKALTEHKFEKQL